MDARNQATEFCRTFNALSNEMSKLIVGNEHTIQHLLICLFTGGHALLEGMPGLGKTRMVQTLSQCLGLELSRIQFTPDLMPADIIGTDVMTEVDGKRSFHFQPGPVFGQVLLADEINRATPKTQSALLEAMQERTVTIGGHRHDLPDPFFVLATQNPIELEGTYVLPEAQIDRFMFKLDVGLPRINQLTEIIERTTSADEPEPKKVSDIERIDELKRFIREIPLSAEVKEYAARLVMATHPESEDAPAQVKRFIRYGASPRGAQALALAGKVKAVLADRFNVSVNDLAELALPALRHRIILNFEGEAEGISRDAILQDVLAAVPSP